MQLGPTLALGLLAAAVPTVASAAYRHHGGCRGVAIAQLPCTAQMRAPSPYAGAWQAEVIARAAARMQRAPGVTNELAPDARETATGGPVGGVPGFDGL